MLLFNFCGYQWVLTYLQQHHAASLEQQVDRQDYDEAELVSVKTKLHLPYYNSDPRFERAYGSVHINGQDYEYVKKRVYNDTLELLCLPDRMKTKLKAAGSELARSATDQETSAPQKTAIKLTLPQYCSSFFEAATTALVQTRAPYAWHPNHALLAGYTALPEQPPRPAADRS